MNVIHSDAPLQAQDPMCQLMKKQVTPGGDYTL